LPLVACGLALFTTPAVNAAPLITPGHLLLGLAMRFTLSRDIYLTPDPTATV